MAGTLIFTTHSEERERLAALLDGHMTRNVNDVVEMLNAGKTVVVPMGLCTGWRAPTGTKILFSATFPKDGPQRAQAELRANTFEALMKDANPLITVDTSAQKTLRDEFAMGIDKDEYGDLCYRHVSRELGAKLVGRPHPEEPAKGEDRMAYQLEKMKWDMALRAAVRFMFADALLAAREGV